MNRVIKFRAWDKIDCMFLTGSDFFLKADGTLWLNFGNGEEVPATEGRFELSQFTGLLDNNGKEIYEADIVATPLGNPFVIKWDAKMSMWDLPRYQDESPLSAYEVIGNIYESPNLLNK